MIWDTYLNTASAKLFGTTKGKDGESHRPSDALNALKQTIGLILLDKNYFTNEEYITYDLIKFSQRIILEGEEDEEEGKELGK